MSTSSSIKKVLSRENGWNIPATLLKTLRQTPGLKITKKTLKSVTVSGTAPAIAQFAARTRGWKVFDVVESNGKQRKSQLPTIKRKKKR